MNQPTPSHRPVRAGLRLAGVAAILTLSATQASATITPGSGIAGVRLGDSQEQVKKVLGEPGKGSTPLNYRYSRGLGVYFIGGSVFEITALKAGEATPAGIGVGATQKAVAKAYPKARCAKAVGTVECTLKGSVKGRSSQTLFTVKGGKVTSISVRFA